MPAAAVANLTPASGGKPGTAAGASGETVATKALLFFVAGGRRCALGQTLDLGALTRLGDEVLVRLLHQHGLDAILHRIEGRRLALALVLDLDDVPAELALHRIGNLALVELEGGFAEFGNDLVLGDEAEIAA